MTMNVVAGLFWLLSAACWIRSASLRRPPFSFNVSAGDPKPLLDWFDATAQWNKAAAILAGVAAILQAAAAFLA